MGLARFGDRAAGAWRYSTLKLGLTARAREIARYGPVVPGKPAAWQRSWAQLQADAERVLAGKVPSPCGRRANHWRGRLDPLRSWMRPVRCWRKVSNVYGRGMAA